MIKKQHSTRPARPGQRPLKLMLMLPLLASIQACQTLSGVTDAQVHGAATSVACNAFRPITYSKLDTLETQNQVREHNAVGVSICSWMATKAPTVAQATVTK